MGSPARSYRLTRCSTATHFSSWLRARQRRPAIRRCSGSWPPKSSLNRFCARYAARRRYRTCRRRETCVEPALTSAQKRSDFGVRAQLGKVVVGRELRFVALDGDHAQESHRCIAARAKLMPRHRRNAEEVVLPQRVDASTDERGTCST